jgi:ABC-type multidrug transport system permease subunit
MPGWLQAIAVVNPLSYVVDATAVSFSYRDLSGLVMDLIIIVASAAVLLTLASLGLRRMWFDRRL